MTFRVLGTEARELRCPLSDSELQERGEQMAEKLAEIDKLEASFELVRKQHNAQVKEIEGDLHAVAIEVREKSEFRQVECVTRIDLEAKVVEVIREDTGEIIKSRAATKDELQGKLFPLAPESASL